jgi:methionine-S-sulfoxide reductase
MFMKKILFVFTCCWLVVSIGIPYAKNAQDKKEVSPMSSDEKLKKATFAGGCFWCMEPPFDKLDGVVSTTSGYAGGAEKNPTYEAVSAGATGHAEVVQVVYDPEKISYETLLDVFWRNIDPTTRDRQFVDAGAQYRSAIFYHDEEQKRLAEASKAELAASGRFKKPIVTDIEPLAGFHPAEDYHQDYYMKNPLRYKFYRHGSGRDRFLEKIWDQADSKSGD